MKTGRLVTGLAVSEGTLTVDAQKLILNFLEKITKIIFRQHSR
jgi:hypothetical protein